MTARVALMPTPTAAPVEREEEEEEDWLAADDDDDESGVADSVPVGVVVVGEVIELEEVPVGVLEVGEAEEEDAVPVLDFDSAAAALAMVKTSVVESA